MNFVDKIRNWLSPPRVEPSLRQLLADARSSDRFPVADLRPVLIPSEILEGDKWFGPNFYFPNLPVSLTWAFLRPEQSMMYLSATEARTLESEGLDWRALSYQASQIDFEARP